MSRPADQGRLIYVGNLPADIKERELDDLFAKYGRIKHIEIKMPTRPPAFAFVEFEDRRDAEDAVRGRDNYDFDGSRLRVELARGNAREKREDRKAPTRSQYRVLVHGLPISASWQDLKDHFRKVVKPSFTNIKKDRGEALGIVEFESADDMERAIRKLDDTEFKNPYDKTFIRIVEDEDGDRGGGRGGYNRGGRDYRRGRSPPRGRSRSRSRSPPRGRSNSRSPERGRSKSPRNNSPSRSHSPRANTASRSQSPPYSPAGKQRD